MRLLHILPTYHPAVRYGGPIFSVHALCRALAAAGHDVHVATTSVNGPADSDVPCDRPVDIDGVKVHYHRSRFLRRLYYSRDLSRFVRSFVPGVDLVHLHSVFLFPTWAAARACRRTGVPYVLSPRGMLVRGLIERRSSLVKMAWLALIERRNLAGASLIHLTAEEERRALLDLNLDRAPISVIPNGADLPPSCSATPSPDVAEMVKDGFDLLCFGRINWKKGLDRLVRAMPALPQTKLLIAGYDDDNLTPALNDLATELQVSDRVRILPRQISGADKEALFGAAKLFVLPSLSENFGNVVTEAMIRGVPVAAARGVGAGALIQASGCGAVVGDGTDELSRKLADLLANPSRLAAMGRAGAIYAAERLLWDRVVAQYVSAYQAILRATDTGLAPEQEAPAQLARGGRR